MELGLLNLVAKFLTDDDRRHKDVRLEGLAHERNDYWCSYPNCKPSAASVLEKPNGSNSRPKWPPKSKCAIEEAKCGPGKTGGIRFRGLTSRQSTAPLTAAPAVSFNLQRVSQ